MKIYTKTEWEWDGEKYRPVKSESFEYSGPVTLLKSDPIGLGDFVDSAANHVENVWKGYQKDPERAALGINTTYEDKLWGSILGKNYDDALVGDLATEGSPNTKTDRKTAQAKGIDMGSTELVDGVAQALAMYFGGSAIGGAMSGGETVAGTQGAETGVLGEAETAPMDIPAGDGPSLAEGTADVSTSGSQTLTGDAANDTLPGSSMPPANAESTSSLEGQGLRQTGPSGEWQPAASSTPSQGLIQSGLEFVKDNPLTTLGAGQLVSGVVSGIGNNITQNQIADKKAKSDRDLLAAKTQEEAAALEARRRFIQSGSYFGASLPMSTGAAQPLRRPDGSLVYTPNGLIASAMR